MIRAASAASRQRSDGHIVNIVSTAAKRAWANASAYHASKVGSAASRATLHVEAATFGIKVTTVIAGGMRTPFLLDRFPDDPARSAPGPAQRRAAIRFVLDMPPETVIPEVMVLPVRETSWP